MQLQCVGIVRKIGLMCIILLRLNICNFQLDIEHYFVGLDVGG